MGSVPQDGTLPPDMINLQLGWPTPRLFASESILSGANAVLTSQAETAAALIYGPHIGHGPLRKSVAEWLSTVYGRPVISDRLCISNGASANLSNVLQKFTDCTYTRRIFMVEPTYFLACPIFEDNGFKGKLRGVPEGESGIDVDFLRKALQSAEDEVRQETQKSGRQDVPACKTGKEYPKIYKHIIYVVPTFSNPSGKTMPEETRQDLVALARKYDALIVTDDVYDFLNWTDGTAGEASPLPRRLVDVDQDMDGYGEWGNTLSNGSFSKIIGPGVRVGWADCSPAFAVQLSEVGSSSSGGAPSHLVSTFVDKMLRTGGLQKHIATVLVPEYQKRCAALYKAVEERLTPLGTTIESTTGTGVSGGFFAYLKLPSDLPPAKIVASVALRTQSLRVAFGDMFTVTGDEGSVQRAKEEGGFARCIRLCWAWHEPDEIYEGVVRLADTIIAVRGMIKSGENLDEYAKIGIR